MFLGLQTLWPNLLMKPDFLRFRVFFGACSLRNEFGDPHFFCLFGKSRSLPFCVASFKISVRGNILGVNVLNCSVSTERATRDFKIWYGKALVRRQIVKFTSGGVMTRVPVRLSRRSLAFYYGKVPGFTYSSPREYKPAVYFSF